MSDWFQSAFGLACIGGWLTSIAYATKRSEWLLVLADLIVWPFGMLHGIGLWFWLW